MNEDNLIDAGRFPGINGGERIQAAIDSHGSFPRVVHAGPQGPDAGGRWILTRALLLPSHTTLVLHGARLFLADGVSDNLIRNLYADSGDDRRDEDIHIQGYSGADLDGNAVNQARQPQVCRNFGISFHKVDHSSIRGIALGPTEGWGMGLENVTDLFVDGISFRQDGQTRNQDGVHVSGPGSRICISNILGTVADDAIAIDAGACAEDFRGAARGSGGLLENVVVSNVSVKNLSAGAVVRTLASRGKPLDGVFISQVAIDGANQVLKIGWDRWGARQGGRDIDFAFPTCDEHKNIVIDGVKGSTPDVFCRIESNVKNLTIRNVRGNCGGAALSNICSDGYCFSMQNVLLDDWILEGCRATIEIGAGVNGGVGCSNLTVRNSVFSAATREDSVCVHLGGRGETLSVNRMTFDNVIFNGFTTGVKIDPDVRIAQPVRIVNSNLGSAQNELQVPIEKVVFG